jgi:hypothetical protein
LADVPAAAGERPARGAFWKLYLLLGLCVAPVVASYLLYYVFPPSERSNYGDLIEPQRPVPALAADLVQAPSGAAADAKPVAALREQGLAAFRGKWVMLAIDKGACALPCAEKLFFMRQTHVSLGKERSRVVRVLLVTDATPLPAAILTAHPDMTVLRVDPHDLPAIFPVGPATGLADHIYLIDPLHNLMMRFPENPDPSRTRKDLQKLMRASRIG